MGLLDRLRGAPPPSAAAPSSLTTDAVAMRETLDGMLREAGGVSLSPREAVRDLLEGEVEAPTADVAELRARRTDPDDFYDREVAPSWDGLTEAQRAARLDGFLEMCMLLESSGDLMGVPPDMAVSVRTRALVLAWVFDQEYSYLSRLARKEFE